MHISVPWVYIITIYFFGTPIFWMEIDEGPASVQIFLEDGRGGCRANNTTEDIRGITGDHEQYMQLAYLDYGA